MQRLNYRVYVDVPDSEPLEVAQRATEDALEALVVNGRTVDYVLIGTAQRLPERAERCTHGAGVVCPEEDGVV